MEFLKKHYEKVILSVVLLGLGAAAYWLPMAVQQAESESQIPKAPPSPKSNAVPVLEFTNELAALQKMTNPALVSFSGDHRLLSPATWKKMPDGTVKKFTTEGTDALTIVSNRPLYTTITFDRVATGGFYINVQQQTKGTRDQEYLKVNEKSKTKLFTVRDAKGNADDPSEVVIDLADVQDPVSLKKGQPFQKVEGYSSDLKYAPENKTFSAKRVGESITFGGQTYKIVYIGSNEVRVTDQTGKQTTIGTR